ncbi:hypothetical protein ACFLQJ_02700, partial [Calditrichota bacterium]
GLLATVDVTMMEKDNILTVPLDAILRRDEQDFVVAVEENIAKLTAVTTGIRSKERIEIASGLESGVIVAVYGHTAIENDSKIKIINE